MKLKHNTHKTLLLLVVKKIDCNYYKSLMSLQLSFQALTPQNGPPPQIIRRLLPENGLSVFDHFLGLALRKG